MENEKLSLFVRVATKCAKYYLASGGPTSRLEDKLSDAGTAYGFKTEVFATPTGVFVSSISADGKQITTLLDRIKESSINLSQLARMEQMLQSLSIGELSLEKTLQELEEPQNAQEYPQWFALMASFGIGTFASFMRYGDLLAGLTSGLITVMVYILTGPMVAKLKMSGIFSDFFSCFLAFVFAGIFSQYLNIPPEAIAVGAVALLVPGLTITTAISELADHNFASGTIKLMKGALTLFAMATAYWLVRDISTIYFEFGDVWFGKIYTRIQAPAMAVILSNMGLILSFAIIFQVPVKALPLATISGMIGWFVFHHFQKPELLLITSFLASFSVGLSSFILSRFAKLPSQIYSVPGILSLLPGMLAMSGFSSFDQVNPRPGSEVVFNVVLVACSIVFGLLAARLPVMLTFKNKIDHI